MHVRIAGITIAVAAVFLAGQGCKKSSEKEKENAPSSSKVISGPVDTNILAQASLSAGTMSRVHWMGIRRLRPDTNAAMFLNFWDQPASVALEAHVLDKLAKAPSFVTLLRQKHSGGQESTTEGRPSATNATAALLRPLLDDIANEECFLEVAHPTNAAGALAFAIRVDEQRAGVWENNLGQVLEAWSGGRVNRTQDQKGRWQLRTEAAKTGVSRQIDFARAGEWTVVGFANGGNPLFQQLVSQIQKDWIPYARDSKFWLESDLDLRAIGKALSLDWKLPENFPSINLSLTGERGENVVSKGEFEFPKPPLGPLKPWIIPTNLVLQPLWGFTAIRGIAPLLQKLDLFSSFKPEDVPDQLYIWDRTGPPFSLFFALPVKDATTSLNAIAAKLIPLVNPRLTVKLGSLSLETKELKWNGTAYGDPFLRTETNSQSQFLFGGFGPYVTAKTTPMPEEIITHLNQTTNLVWFDWENSAERTVHWRYLDDVYRLIFDRHGPRLGWTPSLDWFENNMTNLAFSVTDIKQPAPNRLSLGRRSTLGLSGLELDLLAEWIELPQFPRGLTTIMATNPAPVVRTNRLNRIGTNAVPAAPDGQK